MWLPKIIFKVLLSRLPVKYSIWKRLNIFRHGQMESFDYSKRIFEGLYQDMNKINFDKSSTTITYGKRNFIYDFLSSMRQKINDPLGVRKKRREEGR